MKIKWIVSLFVFMFFLQSCTEELQQNAYINVTTLPEVTEVEEDFFWVSNSGLPKYALLQSPEISEIEFLEEGKVLDFNFMNPEKLKGLLIDVESKMKIRLEVGDHELFFTLDEGVNNFDLNLDDVTKHVRLTVMNIEKNKVKVNDILFETLERVEEAVYQSYIQKEAAIIDFTLTIDWSSDPKDNLSYMDSLLQTYPFNNWHYFVKPIDLKQLVEAPEKWIGYPVLISGPVEMIETEELLSKVYIKNGFLDEPMIMYIDKELNRESCINTIAVFLGYDDGLVFFSQRDTLDK